MADVVLEALEKGRELWQIVISSQYPGSSRGVMAKVSRTVRVRAGQAAFVIVLAALCLATTALPSKRANSAPEGATTTTTEGCGSTCSAGQNPSGVAAGGLMADPVWGVPVSFDEFDGSLDTSKWYVYDYPNGSPKRVKANVRTAPSELQLVGTYPGGSKTQIGAGLSSNFNQMYGRWEVRARTDKGAGFSPTILLWPSTNDWPTAGEIDLLESPRGDRSRTLAVIHNGPTDHKKSKDYGINASDWHTYAVEWLPGRVTYFIDGAKVWEVTDKTLVPKVTSMHLALQLDAGCGWIQCPNAQTPAETVMHVDWTKVYKAPDSMLQS
jgi:beta-glucanase (GH16 family)